MNQTQRSTYASGNMAYLDSSVSDPITSLKTKTPSSSLMTHLVPTVTPLLTKSTLSNKVAISTYYTK